MAFEWPFATYSYLSALDFVDSVAALIMEKRYRQGNDFVPRLMRVILLPFIFSVLSLKQIPLSPHHTHIPYLCFKMFSSGTSGQQNPFSRKTSQRFMMQWINKPLGLKLTIRWISRFFIGMYIKVNDSSFAPDEPLWIQTLAGFICVVFLSKKTLYFHSAFFHPGV